MSQNKINVGGQAVIEGVMIRGPGKYVVSVRKGKKIISKEGRIPSKPARFLKLPFVRGFVNLADMLVIGIRSLMWSAEQAAGEKEKLSRKEISLTLLVSVGFVILFMIALPYFLTHLFGFAEEKQPLIFNLIDGLIRIVIFLAYIFAISFMKDVKVLFQYHGAEHKAIHCYEHGKNLSQENVRKFTTLHPRCGTSFLLLVFIVSILVFSILPSVMLHYLPNFSALNPWLRKGILFPIRVLLIPLIAGISYEILKLSDRKQDNPLFRLISAPGLLLQRITTQEPDKSQVEVAIHSLDRLLKIEKNQFRK